MKWFKHDASANMDAKLKKVRMKYGMEGYGLYWLCLELIAQNVEKHNLSFALEHDSEVIAFDSGINRALVEEMINYMVELKLFENVGGIIYCLKMSTKTDEYVGKLLRSSESDSDSLQRLSGESPDKSRTKSRLTEENRTEENRTDSESKAFNQFWSEYPKKKNKDSALKAFRKRKPDDRLLNQMLEGLDIAKRSPDWLKDEGKFIPYPATWLNAGGWKDELVDEAQDAEIYQLLKTGAAV